MEPARSPAKSPWRRRAGCAAAGLLVLAGIAWIARDAIAAHVVRYAVERAGAVVTLDGLAIASYFPLDARVERLSLARGGDRVEGQGLHVVADLTRVATDPWEALEAFEAASLTLDVDLTRHAPSSGSPKSDGLALPDTLPRIDVESLDARLVLASHRSFVVRGGQLFVTPADASSSNGATEQARSDTAAPASDTSSGRHAAVSSIAASASSLEGREGDVTRNHPFALEGSWADHVLAIDVLRYDPTVDVESARLDLGALERGEISAAVRGRLDAGRIALDATLRGSDLVLDVDAENVALERALDFLGVDADVRARVDVQGRLNLPLDAPRRWTARALVEASDVDVLGVGADFVRGTLDVAATKLEIEDTLVLRGTSSLRVPFATVRRGANLACAWREELFVVLELDARDAAELAKGTPLAASLEGLPRASLELSTTLVRGRLELLRGRLDDGVDEVVIRAGSVPLATDVRALRFDPSLDASLDVRVRDLARARTLAAAFAPDLPPLEGRVDGSLDLRGTERGLLGVLDLRATGLRVGDVAASRALVRAALDEAELRVDALEADTDAGSLHARGAYVFRERVVRDGELALEVPDLARVTGSADLAGSVSITARLDGPLDALDARVDAEGRDVDAFGLALADARVRARATAGRWRFHEVSAALDRARFVLAGDAVIDVSARSIRANVDRCDVATPNSAFVLARPTLVDANAFGLRVRDLVLAGGDGALRADVEHGPSGTCATIDLELAAAGDLVEDLLGRDRGLGPVRGATAHADVVRTGGELFASVSGSARLVMRGNPGSIAFEMAATPGRLDVTHAELDAGEFGHASAHATIPLDSSGALRIGDGAFELSIDGATKDLAALGGSLGLPGARGSAEARIELAGTASRPTGTFLVRASELALPPLDASLPPLGAATIELEGSVGERIEVARAVADVPGLMSLSGTASLAAPLDLAALARGDRDELLDAPIVAQLEGGVDDLAPLAAHLTKLRRLGGVVRIDARLAGSLRAPRPEGAVTIQGGEMRALGDLPPLRALEGRIVLTPDRLSLEGVTGELGSAPLLLTGGVDLGPEGPEFDLALRGTDVLLYRRDRVVVRADADLALTGTFKAPRLSGKIDLVRSRFARRFDWLGLARPGQRAVSAQRGLRLFSFDEPPLDRLAFDVQVSAREAFAIETNMAKGSVSPALRLEGTGALPRLVGTISVLPTRVALPAGRIDVTGGRIDFRVDRPGFPEIELRAQARMQGYDVSIVIDGPYDAPTVELASVPPLPREDLALLVLTGRPPRRTSAVDLGAQTAREIAVFLATDVLAKVFVESDATAEDIASRLEVVAGSDVSRRGQDTILARFRIADDLVSERDALYLVGERDEYDADNFGFRWVFRFR